MVDNGFSFQDARDILPIATKTYIIAEMNLKEFMSTFAYRSCSMFQPQMVHVMWRMRKLIVDKYSMLEDVLKMTCQKQGRCTYQGWEDVTKACNLPYAKDRTYKSELTNK